MSKDFGKLTINVNRYYFTNFAIGIDVWRNYTFPIVETASTNVQLSFLFFNVTISYWHNDTYFPGV